MKPPANPSFPTFSILVFVLCAAIVVFVAGICGGFAIRNGLATGRVYSPLIIWNVKNVIYRTASPVGYWTMIGLYSLSCIGGLGFGTLMPVFIISAYKNKLARQKKERGKE